VISMPSKLDDGTASVIGAHITRTVESMCTAGDAVINVHTGCTSPAEFSSLIAFSDRYQVNEAARRQDIIVDFRAITDRIHHPSEYKEEAELRIDLDQDMAFISDRHCSLTHLPLLSSSFTHSLLLSDSIILALSLRLSSRED
jgi:hypothetical protein